VLYFSPTPTARVGALEKYMNPRLRIHPGLPALLLASMVTPHAGAEQEPIVVTATRVVQSADETLSSVTVITREDIERSQASSLSDLLQGVAGINTVSQGGAGKLTSLYLRGSNPGHVSVLIDGIRMGSVTAGTVAWEFLPLAQVERIEIVRGPNSALYGSEAIGGVIQIFTRRGDTPPRWSASAGAGRYNSRELAADYSGSRDNYWISVRVASEDSDGFDARQPTLEFGSLVDEPDHDGYDNRSASVRLGHRFADDSELEFHGLHAEGNTEYDADPAFANEDDYLQQALGVTLRTAPLDNWDLTVTAGRSLDERDSFRTGVPAASFKFDTERRTFSLQNDFTLASDDMISVGFDYHDDRVDSTTTYDESSRATSALFAQYQGTAGKHSVLARIRPLDDEQFGRHTTGNLAWGYQAGQQTRLTLSYGSAFKAPTFNDLYFPGFSNPDLQPEESETLELGVQGVSGPLGWDVRAFRTRIDDLIVFDNSTLLPGNVNKAEIDGLEATLSGTLLGWDSSTALTLLDPQDSISGNILPRRAKRSLRVDLDRQFGRLGAGATLIAQSSRYDDSANSVNVAGFGIVNLRGSWQLARGWLLQGRVDNLFDKDYQTIATYNTPGRSLFVTLRYDHDGQDI
jgi:vitamin B12 transporter